MSQASKPKKLSLAAQIFIALVLAVIIGLALQSKADFAAAYIKPFGTIFLNLVKFIVGPIVLFSIMAGVVSMRDIKKVGQIGGITVVYYFCTTAVATAIGLVIANLFKNGFPVLETSSLTYEAPAATAPMDVLVNIFPNNFLAPITEANMLQVIVMALLISFAIILLGEKAQKAVDGINLWNDIFMKCMEMILRLSPIGVFCLLCPVVAANGAMVIGSLAKVILAAYCAYLLHAIIESLIGAMGLKDIGTHFPDTDPRYKGISSLLLLDETYKMLEENGYEIVNIDSLINIEKPKMAPHIDQMRRNIAEHLHCDESRINVKATRGEGLGFVGRGEGAIAYAVCLIDEKR